MGRFFEFGSDRLEVVGVMPEDFRFVVHSSLGEPRVVDVWLPIPWPLATMSDGQFSFAALVRLKPGVQIAQTQLELWLVAAAVGLGLAALILPLIASCTTLPLPRLHEVRLDWTLSAITMAGGLIFGVVPALRATSGVAGAATSAVGRGNSARPALGGPIRPRRSAG